MKMTGSNNFCGDRTPHFPHWTGDSYETVRYGTVQRFCPGVQGPGKEFSVIRREPGSGDNLAILEWIAKEKLFVDIEGQVSTDTPLREIVRRAYQAGENPLPWLRKVFAPSKFEFGRPEPGLSFFVPITDDPVIGRLGVKVTVG
jgi:hypothetical protein